MTWAEAFNNVGIAFAVAIGIGLLLWGVSKL